MLLECLLQHLYTSSSEQQGYEKAFIPLQALDSIHSSFKMTICILICFITTNSIIEYDLKVVE